MKPICTKSTQTERETCGRCGGTGKYPSSCYNGVCLGCQGQGYKLTARGREADRYLRVLRSKSVEEVKVGDLVQATFGMGNIRAFGTVLKIERITAANAVVTWEDPITKKRAHGNGFNVEMRHQKFGLLSTSIDCGELVRIAQSAEQKAATLAQALAYQDTLTKQGKPRKA